MFFNKPTNDEAAPAPASVTQGQDIIFDVTIDNFEQSVMLASMEKPVLAYFTASWCGPCKQLGPALSKAVMAANGEVLMGRIDLDANQELAAAMKIQSVPTVLLFFQGRPIDAFQGAVPESQLKAFIDNAVKAARQAQPDALDIPEALKGAAEALSVSDFGAAQAIYAQILQQDKYNAQAFVGLVRTYIAAGHVEQARELVDNAPEEISKHASFSEAKTALELAEQAPAGDLGELQQKVQANAGDHQARFDLAVAQFAAGQKEEALDNLLEILSQNREWNEEAARHQILKFFEALGPSDPLTMQYRRKLSTILFS